MAVTIKGTGIVWGTDGFLANLIDPGVSSTTYTGILSGLTLTRDSNKFDLNDEDGETVGQVFYNLKKTLSSTMTPTGSSIANAVTELTKHVAAAGVAITITDSEGNTEDTYNLISAVENRTQDGAATVDWTMEAFDGNDVSATIT